MCNNKYSNKNVPVIGRVFCTFIMPWSLLSQAAIYKGESFLACGSSYLKSIETLHLKDVVWPVVIYKSFIGK